MWWCDDVITDLMIHSRRAFVYCTVLYVLSLSPTSHLNKHSIQQLSRRSKGVLSAQSPHRPCTRYSEMCSTVVPLAHVFRYICERLFCSRYWFNNIRALLSSMFTLLYLIINKFNSITKYNKFFAQIYYYFGRRLKVFSMIFSYFIWHCLSDATMQWCHYWAHVCYRLCTSH